MRGSRQSVNVKLAAAIFANVSVYLKYDDQVRIEGDPNKLICNQWGGLRSRYVAGALKARSLVDVAFCQPLTFLTHHMTVTRAMIRSIMDLRRGLAARGTAAWPHGPHAPPCA